MTLSRRSLFKLATVTAAGLALPATDILADAEEIARRYWALDSTHLGPKTTPATHAGRVAAWGEDVSPAMWWNVARITGENRYHTTIKTDAPIAHLRVGDAIQIGDLPEGATDISGLERQMVTIRHIDRAGGIVTVTTPVSYPGWDVSWLMDPGAPPEQRDQVWVPNPAVSHRW